MNKKVKIGLIIAIIILVPFGTLALFLLIPKKGNKDIVDPITGKKDTSLIQSSYPLKSGSKGELVKDLQKKLNRALLKLDPRPPVVPYYMGKQITSLAEDGDFGGRTLAVVKFYFTTEQVTESQYKTL